MADFEKTKELVRLYNYGTSEESKMAAEELINDHKAFIIHVINQSYGSYYKNPLYHEDIEQYGILGFLSSLAKYNGSKGALTTYSISFIQHEVAGFIYEQVLNITPHYASALKKINRTIAELQAEGITKISIPLLILETGLTENRIASALSVSKISERADDPQDILSTNYADEKNMSPLEYLEKNEISDLLEDALTSYCTHQEIIAIKWKFHTIEIDKNERDMAKAMKISTDEFRSLVQSGLRNMKKNKAIKKLFDNFERRERYLDTSDSLTFINDKENQTLMHDLLYDEEE